MTSIKSIKKCVLVGDSRVGKTCLMITYRYKVFPEEFVPSMMDDVTTNVEIDGNPINLQLCDTVGKEGYDELRPISYSRTDVFVICFSLINPATLGNVEYKWAPEILQHSPNSYIVLVGTKKDLRDERLPLDKQRESRRKGREMAKKIGAKAYLECSALKFESVTQVFDEVIPALLSSKRKRRRMAPCNIL